MSESGVILRAYNTYLDVSIDNGQIFKRYGPRTIFTTALGGGISGDQVILFVPKVDRFVWFMQHSKAASGEGAFRIAVAKFDQAPGGWPIGAAHPDQRPHDDFYQLGVYEDHERSGNARGQVCPRFG